MAEALPRTAVGDAGEDGIVAGVTALEIVEAADVPTELVAVTVKV